MPLFRVDSRKVSIVVLVVGVPLIFSLATLAIPGQAAQRASLSVELVTRANQDQRPGASSYRAHRSASIDPRGLPSALPKHHRNTTNSQSQLVAASSEQLRARQQANNMRLDESPSDRLANSQSVPTGLRRPASDASTHQVMVHKKRFKSSGRFSATSSETTTTANTSNSSGIQGDLNRNNNTLIEARSHHSRAIGANQHDLNNNSIETEPVQPNRRQNVNSINGTVDLSQYSQADVDRLYGDALLVYFKNFNE